MPKLKQKSEEELKTDLLQIVNNVGFPESMKAAVHRLINQPIEHAHIPSPLDRRLILAISNLVNALLNLSDADLIQFGKQCNWSKVKEDTLLALLLIRFQGTLTREEARKILLEELSWL